MHHPARNRTLLILIVVLLATNFTLLYLLLRPQEKPPELSRSERMARLLEQKLNFDATQKTQYLKLREYRDSLMHPLQVDLRDAKLQMIELLRRPDVPDTTVLATARQIAERQIPVEIAFYHHFRRIQAICQPEQLPRLDSMLVNMVNRPLQNHSSGSRQKEE